MSVQHVENRHAEVATELGENKPLLVLARETSPSKSGGDLHPMFADFIETMEINGAAKSTILNNLSSLRAFDKWLKERDLDAAELGSLAVEGKTKSRDDIREEKKQVARYFAELKNSYAPATVAGHLFRVRHAYKEAVEEGWCDYDPTTRVKVPDIPKGEKKRHSSAELRRLLNAAKDDREYLLLMLFMFTGLRKMDVFNLKWENVDFGNSVLKVFVPKTKVHVSIPLHPALARELKKAWDRREPGNDTYVIASQRKNLPISSSHAHRMLTGFEDSRGNYHPGVFERAGVETKGQPYHVFRKTLSTSLADNGVPDAVIEEICGWESKGMFNSKYRYISDEVKRTAIKKAYADEPIVGLI